MPRINPGRRVILSTLALCAAATLTSLPSRSLAEYNAACAVKLSNAWIEERLNAIRAAGRVCRAAAVAGAAAVEAVQAANAPDGQSALVWNDGLAAAASFQSREMALAQRMSHRDRQDRTLGERLLEHGYRYSSAFENVAVGYGSLDEVVEAWLESHKHCENLMNAAVAEFGIACHDANGAGPLGERRYWTLVLATPKRRP